MAQTMLEIKEIISDPNVRDGRPVIKGTGIKVTDIMFTHTTGDKLSAEEIAEHFQLDVGQVHAALAYYYLHKAELDEEIRRDEETATSLIAELEQQGKQPRFE